MMKDNKKKVGFGILGCGMISDTHARAILEIEDAELLGVCDIDPARAALFAEKYGTKVYADYDAMLSDSAVDAVCI